MDDYRLRFAALDSNHVAGLHAAVNGLISN
jgi:hypothetical protein